MKMAFKDYFGTSQIEPEQTINFVKTWFHPDDEVLIVLMPTTTSKRGTISLSLPARDLAQASIPAIESLSRYEGNLYGLYFGVNPLKANHTVTRDSRGGKKDVREVYGVYADLDVKPGAFESREAIYQYLGSLGITPTAVVENGGSGGVHAYWKLDKPEDAASDIGVMWWAYLDEMAQGRDIDRLTDASRLMRLPGAVYYPKDAVGLSGTVRVVQNSGLVYNREAIENLAQPAYERYNERKAQTKARVNENRSALPQHMLEALKAGGNNTWTVNIAKIVLSQKIEAMDWDDILIPAGWTHIGDGEEGTRKWARPGVTRKSAHTDWNGSNVMSLHSWSEETRLADLKEAGIPLTKEVVLLRLQYNDDVAAMVADLSN